MSTVTVDFDDIARGAPLITVDDSEHIAQREALRAGYEARGLTADQVRAQLAGIWGDPDKGEPIPWQSDPRHNHPRY